MGSERRLEDLLASHPYLIDPELEGIRPLRQERRGNQRLDLAFPLTEGLCLVELKVVPLQPAHLDQLVGYCQEWSKEHPLASHHYLIGWRPPETHPLEQLAAESGYQIRLRYLGEQIPLHLTWDVTRRRYLPSQFGSRRRIRLVI
jgi:hypothetical protein